MTNRTRTVWRRGGESSLELTTSTDDWLATSGRLWPTVFPGVCLGIAGTLVAIESARFPSSATLLQLALLCAISLVGLTVAAWTRRADWWLATLIIILAMFPNSEVNPDLRVVAGGFRIFLRLVLGAVSPWDMLLMILPILALWMHPRRERQARQVGQSSDVFLVGLIIVYGIGVANGLIHALILNYGPTSFRSVVQQGLPIFYLFACVVLGRRAVTDPRSMWKVIWAVRLSSVAILLQGSLLLALALRGEFSALRGFLGIPIVLYDQLIFLNVAMLLTAARFAAGLKIKTGDWILASGSVLFLLLSTRRLVLIMLVVTLGLVFVLAVRRGRLLGSLARATSGFVAVGVMVLTVASLSVPAFVEAVGLVINSVNLTSEVGQEKGGALMLVETENLAQNLGPTLTPSWIIGRGVGTYWMEYVPTELALDKGSAAFVESQLEAGAEGWWPNFHLPFIALVYRFGILGTAVIWSLVFGWFFRWRSYIRTLKNSDKAFAVVVVVLAALQLLAIGESTDSAGPAFLGFLVAALSALRMTPLEEQRDRVRDA